MASREAGKSETESRNPLLPQISVRKWEPDKKMMQSIDETMTRATGGREPDQWHKDYSHAGR